MGRHWTSADRRKIRTRLRGLGCGRIADGRFGQADKGLSLANSQNSADRAYPAAKIKSLWVKSAGDGRRGIG
jgi:hypothetical protein